MAIKWTLERRKLSSLTANPKNPRTLSKTQAAHLETSLATFGVCEPIVINTDGMIIGGHQRVRTLKKMKAKEVDVYVPERTLTEKETDELNIRLNKNVGEFDFDILANEWNADDLLSWGFDLEELLGEDAKQIKPEEEDEGELEPPKDPKTKTGDLYQMGDHRLLCGDSTRPDDVAKLLDGAEPILMVTDPPYGVNYDAGWRKEFDKHPSKKGRKTKSLGKVQNDDRVNWSLAWHLFPGSVAYVWCASWFLPEVAVSLDQVDFERKSLIIWAKQHFALSRGDYHWQHEICWYVVKKGHQHNWQGSRKESTIWQINNRSAIGDVTNMEEGTGHGTQKPLECMARPIRNNSAPGEGVYDPFVGSGTTLIAAEQLSRKCYAMEIAPEYCDIVVSRWVKYRRKNNLDDTVLLNGNKIEWAL